MHSRLNIIPTATPGAVRAQLRRILESDGFIRCPRMQRFLQFIVDEYLDGRANQLGEYGIGVSVYDRGPDFQPALDPIVRNDARRLRTKLLEYYRVPRAENELLIEIPKGGYVPTFAPISESGGRSGIRLAVLPFEILVSRGDAGLCSRALCLSISAGLTSLDGVETVAHAMCSGLPMREMAAEFQLTHLVQGSVVGYRDGLRVVINLIRLADGTQLWAQEFDLGQDGFSAVQSSVARAVAGEVTARHANSQMACALAMAA